jgi:MoaA/NifB/PqqE/SkfB family radical SAM enzyme
MRRPLPTIPADRALLPAPPSPAEGVVSWNMNTTCNFRCSYCTQRFLDDRGRWARDLPAFIAAFGALPGESGVPWEIKLSGGEPFLHPGFLDVVTGLRDHGLFLSVVTNFSKEHLVLPFLRAAGDRLRVLSCSLHLEYVDIDDRDDDRDGDSPRARDARKEPLARFLARAQEAEQALPPGASLVVTCVATRANLPRLPALQQRFRAAGLRLKVQPEKQDREVIDYTPHERAALVRLGGHNDTGRIAADFGGQPCWAGSRYFVVDDRGDAWRCYPARRYRAVDRGEHLGNLVHGTFRLHDAARPCLYRYCNCTVPIARGMMPVEAGVDRLALATAVE